MRWLTFGLAALLVLIQYPLWIGKGGWLRVSDLEQQVKAQRESNAKLRVRNDAMSAEVKDLKTGTEAIEERARAELGMVKADEIFVQLIDVPKPSSTRPSRFASTTETLSAGKP
jgi:cell division protein FtsB